MKHWALRILAWDGLLPAVLLVVPFLVRATFPQLPNAIVFIAVVLPIAALFLRLYAGCCHIAANHCGPILRHIQSASLMMGIFALMLIDAVLIGLQGMPGKPIWRDPNELRMLTGIYAFYVACMAITLYPGNPDADSTNLDSMLDPDGGEPSDATERRSRAF